jgi:EAP30/Vps36 family
VSADDIIMAVSQLKPLGGGFRVLPMSEKACNKSENMLIVSVPTELDQDHTMVLSLAAAQDTGDSTVPGQVSIASLRSATGWTTDRCERALELLLHQGMAWLDVHHGESFYWFPSLWQRERIAQDD